eukprot:scaffold33786_cov124-Isochrysis_galbana.AAC.5
MKACGVVVGCGCGAVAEAITGSAERMKRYSTGRTHSLQTHHPPRPHHPRKRTHPPIRHPPPHDPHVRAQKRKLPAHGGMQRDPQIIYAHQLT